MGFGTHGEGHKFVNITMGKMHAKIGDEVKDFDFYDGMLQEIGIEDDTFEGQSVPKVFLMMQDDKGEKVRIKFTLEGWYSIGFFARIEKIDLTKPFRLGVFQSEKNEKISFCYLRQGAKIEANKDIPKPKDVTIGKKTLKDWTECNKRVEAIISSIMAKLNRQPTEEDVPSPNPDDLPF